MAVQRSNSTSLTSKAGILRYFSLPQLQKQGFGRVSTLPYCTKVLLESCLRNCDGFQVTDADVAKLANWDAAALPADEIPFKPARVLLQDFTGVPATVDLAAMRSAMKRAGGDPRRINPLVPVDLVIDHSVQVDYFGRPDAESMNVAREFERNRERYEFLKWAQKSFDNFRVVPPSNGICHQVNLEYLARVVMVRDGVAFPDSLVGTDSHTTMINGLGIVGWGVGGIEAEACMLGQPIYMLAPQVVVFRLTGQLPEGTTATDLVLTITQILRKHGVVEKFVEYFGDGLDSMTVADRATIANMSPEYGATVGFFPIDDQTLAYLRLTGRDEKSIDLIERYCKEQGLWRQKSIQPRYSQMLELDLGTVKPCMAGPKRPQDRVLLPDVRKGFQSVLVEQFRKEPAPASGTKKLTHGAVVIAAITSCTNTSNPSVMLAAGILARKAVEKGLQVPDYVKPSLSPGSRTVIDYYEKAGLLPYLEKLGFHNTGFGCMTCIGNSGPLPDAVAQGIESQDIVAVSVLSGNRNFEGRVNPLVKANYLASPPLVVAYALAGTVEIDLQKDAIGTGSNGKSVYLRDIWPTQAEIADAVQKAVDPAMFRKEYADVANSSALWNAIEVTAGDLFAWNPKSTYIQEPPFFTSDDACTGPQPINGARVLVMVGDSVTTDHISPAGNIKKNSPAGEYLTAKGVSIADFNQYGARRGNDRVMIRGTFANIRLKNLLAPGTEGGVTRHLPSGEQMSIFDASAKYQQQKTPLLVLAGKDYGMGSSRDWAAKGVMLLGVKAVIAESFERIHRSNLVGMGVLPLQYAHGQTRATLGLTGEETFDIQIPGEMKPKQEVQVIARSADGSTRQFSVRSRIDTPVEIDYYRNGGILNTVLAKLK
jgi:aconitate hydratase